MPDKKRIGLKECWCHCCHTIMNDTMRHRAVFFWGVEMGKRWREQRGVKGRHSDALIILFAPISPLTSRTFFNFLFPQNHTRLPHWLSLCSTACVHYAHNIWHHIEMVGAWAVVGTKIYSDVNWKFPAPLAVGMNVVFHASASCKTCPPAMHQTCNQAHGLSQSTACPGGCFTPACTRPAAEHPLKSS